MVNKKSSKVIAAIISLLTFLSVTYVTSCTKQGPNKYSCEGVVCLNGGYCDSARCICPMGFEGANCSVPSTAKYIGSWNAMKIIIGSDSARYIHDTTYFPIFLKPTATPTTFFIFNFNNNPNYNDIVCVIDSPRAIISAFAVNSTDSFTISTTPNVNMISDHYSILWGYGTISSGTIDATYASRYINRTVNWEIDTVRIILTPQ